MMKKKCIEKILIYMVKMDKLIDKALQTLMHTLINMNIQVMNQVILKSKLPLFNIFLIRY